MLCRQLVWRIIGLFERRYVMIKPMEDWTAEQCEYIQEQLYKHTESMRKIVEAGASAGAVKVVFYVNIEVEGCFDGRLMDYEDMEVHVMISHEERFPHGILHVEFAYDREE